MAERAGLPAVACEALEVAGRVARQRDLQAAEAAFARGLAVATAHGLRLWRLRALHELGTVDQLRSVARMRSVKARMTSSSRWAGSSGGFGGSRDRAPVSGWAANSNAR